MIALAKEPAVCPRCGNPYIQEWTELGTVNPEDFTGQDGLPLINDGSTATAYFAPAHNPCPDGCEGQ